MSIINKMLQELDRRNAIPTASEPGPVAGRVRAVSGVSVGSEGFWWILAALILLVVAWVGWVMWQLTPRNVVTDLAMQSVGKVRPPEPVAVNPSAVQDAQAAVGSALATPGLAPVGAEAPPAPAPVADAPKIDMLKLATEILTEIPAPRARRTPDKQTLDALPPKPERAAKKAEPAPKSAGRESVAAANQAVAVPPAAPAAAIAPRLDPTPPVARASIPQDAKIEKRPTVTVPRDQAEIEYQRGLTLVNQGRMAEGMESIRLALTHFPAHDAARQTLVALLIEAKRHEEAAPIIEQGLALDPRQTRLALLSARVKVELGDNAGGLAVLEKYSEAGVQDPNFRAFRAALYQRLNRHADAVNDYTAALRFAPKAGAWWAGLGISQHALNRRAEALEAFKHAQAIGNLGPDLAGFVEQRIRQLN